MYATRKVRWTIISRIPPQPWIACAGCGVRRPFRSSGRTRLNASGKRLDAWLIYRCTICDATWNRPIVERRHVGDIDAAMLAALHGSDPVFVHRQAFDLDTLRRSASRIDEFPDVDILRETLEPAGAGSAIEVELRVPLPSCLRFDRLLATESGLQRGRLAAMCEAGTIGIEPGGGAMLRRRIRDGTRIRIAASSV